MYGANYMHRPPERPGTTGQLNNESRQLEFNQAMNDFKNMFPTLDRDVIEAVLRANNGLVDATIDQLLSMGVDMEGNVPASTGSERPPLPSYSAVNQSEPPPAYTPRDNKSSKSSPPSRPLPARPYSAWNPPLLGKLPDDFLRLGPSTTAVTSPRGIGDSMDDKELEQFLEDEKLAMVLQNEEFMRELRHNKDFMLSLEKDRQRNTTTIAKNTLAPVERTTSDNPTVSAPASSSSSSHSEHSSPPSATPVSVEPVAGAVGGHPASPTHDDAVLREKLRHMGKSTRKKFDKLAKMFHRKNVNRANIIATGSAASTANLLDGYNDDDDDDEILNAMGSARLEIMDERDEDKERETPPQKTVTQSKAPETDQKKPGSVEPIVFFSEDNEFEYKEEK